MSTSPVRTVTAALEEAVEANLQIARLLRDYDKLFRASAEAFARAGDRGVPDLHIAQYCRAAFEEGGFSSPEGDEIYTSPTAVGRHRRTGLILRKPGVLPPGARAQDIQTMVRILTKTAPADAIIRDCSTLEQAWQELCRLTDRPNGPRAKKDKKS